MLHVSLGHGIADQSISEQQTFGSESLQANILVQHGCTPAEETGLGVSCCPSRSATGSVRLSVKAEKSPAAIATASSMVLAGFARQGRKKETTQSRSRQHGHCSVARPRPSVLGQSAATVPRAGSSWGGGEGGVLLKRPVYAMPARFRGLLAFNRFGMKLQLVLECKMP